MPKKFQGENSKAAEARTRELEKKRTVQEQKTKELEDAKWADDDRSVAKKQQRQAELDAKQADKLAKKQEAKQLLMEEESSLKSKSAKPTTKITRAHIEAVTSLPPVKPKLPEEKPLEENVNRLVDDAVIARDVDEAIKVLSVDDTQADKHPERRAAAAYRAFEEVRLPQLKAENSNMRLSQLKQMLKKEWQKSPQNPFNQVLK